MAANPIQTLNEKALHAALKAWYAQPGDALEVPVDGYVVDIVRGDLLIEIQTRNFAAIKRKLAALAAHHPLRLVYPVAQEKWIVRLAADGVTVLGRRRSPRRGRVEHLFAELVRCPHLLALPGFAVEVLLIREEETRRHEAGRAWRRRGWVTEERRLMEVVERRLFETPAALLALVPEALADPFATSDLAAATGQPRWLAQKMAYCLRAMGALVSAGKRGRAGLYRRAP